LLSILKYDSSAHSGTAAASARYLRGLYNTLGTLYGDEYIHWVRKSPRNNIRLLLFRL